MHLHAALKRIKLLLKFATQGEDIILCDVDSSPARTKRRGVRYATKCMDNLATDAHEPL